MSQTVTVRRSLIRTAHDFCYAVKEAGKCECSAYHDDHLIRKLKPRKACMKSHDGLKSMTSRWVSAMLI